MVTKFLFLKYHKIKHPVTEVHVHVYLYMYMNLHA